MKKITLFLFVFVLFAVNLHSQTPQYYNSNTGTSINVFPFAQTGGKAVNSLFLAGEFNQPSPVPVGQRITKVYFRVASATSRTYTNLHILMAQDVITNLTSGHFYPGPYDTVYFNASVTLSATAGGWMMVTLDHPFPYNVTKSLIMFVGQCGATGSGGNVYNSILSGIRRTWSVGGCPFTPYTGGDGYMINFGIDVEPVAPQYYNYNTPGGDNSFPLNQAPGKMVQWLVGPGEYNQPAPALGGGSITGLYFRISGTYPLGPVTYNNFNIRFGQTAITSFTSGSFYSGSMDTVFHRDTLTLQQAVNTWLYFPLDQPYSYDPAQSLVVEVGQCGASGTYTGYSLTHTNITGFNRRIWSVGGCPYSYAGIGVNVVNNGIDIEYPLGVSNNNNQVADVYKLEQNYPNPFNPATSILFSIPKEGNVKLAVFDVLGREVTTLVNEVKTAGSHVVNFNASNLSSGVYIYRIEAGTFKDAKKMLLVK
jgi:Secretion system C-terminal sorting domain